jgi:putative restriction endonuclease
MNGLSMARPWRDSVLDAVVRLSSRHGTQTVQRQALMAEELDRIIEETRSNGATPAQTLSRVLQDLRDEGVLEFLDGGAYRVTKQPVDIELADLTDPEIDAAIRERLLRLGRVETGTAVAEARRRCGQARLRVLVLQNYQSRCAVCDVSDPHLLVASHIVPWATHQMREVISAISSVCAVSTTFSSSTATGC